MKKEALKAAQNVLHNVLMADMNPAKAGRHVSTERLIEMIIKAYNDAHILCDKKTFEDILIPYKREKINKYDIEYNKGMDDALDIIVKYLDGYEV